VVEVSSFQLDSLQAFSPTVALLLNISPDHLDRYPDYDAYIRSKLRIFKDQRPGQYAVLNDDDEALSRFNPNKGVFALRYGRERKNRHAFIEGEKMTAGLPGKGAHVFDLRGFRLPGRHNRENLMGVALAALALDVPPEVIQEKIDGFEGLPHRLEPVGRIGDVDFFNDSKATNVDAASRAIHAFDRAIILIAGGSDKGGDYDPLAAASAGRVKGAVLLGETKALIAESLEAHVPCIMTESMEEAVREAFSLAEPGDVVLLAPACASFDMFSDYAHRGRVFRKAVERLRHGAS
jgi:UDP-N-acetylmuramoylalanine--D-glutamate ligase